ncbi:hypothetical protein VP1G_00676 [Cytospora mali]|uniref:SGNH hydrolase-type esterase domain-containing protein n=1 Tax=Cytospora mali TaxID=578113 RepID=A0A194UNZ7_CYTMA|nr:hypothetical protein VP1G_00676 [Valsa mali var. pyri (nom. inval.)]
MHVPLRLVAVILTTTFASTLAIPDSVPDSLPNSNNGILPPTPAAVTDAVQQQQQQQNTSIKVLVCGDSITQGVDGQFTWRYRLWEWFHANSEFHNQSNNSQSQLSSWPTPSPSPSPSPSSAITTTNDDKTNTYQYPTLQYVGPYNGTLPHSSKNNTSAMGSDPFHPQTWGTYHPNVDPTFFPGGGSAHSAVYGRPAWLYIDLIGAQVQAYQPDFVILHLGFNDIGWWGHRAADLVGTMQRLVFLSRLARSDVAVLIADVSHRVGVTGREDIPVTTTEYNKEIVEKAREWSVEGSPVEVVRRAFAPPIPTGHVESCPAGFDGLHPNSLGDYQIARAYTQVFHQRFNFGSGVLEVPAADTIPGFSSPSRLSSAVNAISSMSSSPTLAMFAGVALLGLVLATVLRPELLRLRRFGKGRYHLLPSR